MNLSVIYFLMIICFGFQSKVRHSIKPVLQADIAEEKAMNNNRHSDVEIMNDAMIDPADAKAMNDALSGQYETPTFVEKFNSSKVVIDSVLINRSKVIDGKKVDDAMNDTMNDAMNDAMIDPADTQEMNSGDSGEYRTPTFIELDDDQHEEKIAATLIEVSNENLTAKESIVKDDIVDAGGNIFFEDQPKEDFNYVEEETSNEEETSSENAESTTEAEMENQSDDIQAAFTNLVSEEEDFDLELDHQIIHENPLFEAESTSSYFESQDTDKDDSEMETTGDPSNVEFIEWEKEQEQEEIFRMEEYLNEADAQDLNEADAQATTITMVPTMAPTKPPTKAPTVAPTKPPTKPPTMAPTKAPTKSPTMAPTVAPTKAPTKPPTKH